MIIGQFCETYPPSLDGVGRVMLAYCKTLKSMGHQAIYVAPDNPLIKSKNECETLLYPSVSISPPYRVGVPSWGREYRRAVKNIQFDLVHTHSPFVVGSAARRIARKRNIPLVATFHSKYYDDFLRATHSKALSRLMVRHIVRFYKTCDEVWTLNAGTAKVLYEYGYEGKPYIMPNGTDIEALSDADCEKALAGFRLREGIPTLIFVGQMDEKKNPQSVLRACALLRERGVEHQLIMVGSGKDQFKLKALCANLGLADSTIFTGFISDRTTTLALLKRSDLFVFPSIYDNAPMVVREASAMGTPSVLVRGTCSAEGITDGDNGFLCDNDITDIADTIMRALPDAKQAGARARDTIPIPWETLMREVLARYELLIKRKHERRSA